MKTKAFAALFLLTITSVHLQSQSPKKYRTYHNERFGFCLEVPFQIFEAQRPPENGDGLRFLSHWGESLLLSYGGHSLGMSLKEHMEFSLEAGDFRDRKRELSYQRIADDFFILSGYVGEKIFYRRTYLENKIFKTLYLEYPKTQKERYDKIISHMVKTFPHCP